jgi:hypothetical protein
VTGDFGDEAIMTDEIRETVGVRNPYALAAFKLGEQVDWESLDSNEKRKKLAEALGMDYHLLFDPVNEGPLFNGPPEVR